MTEITREDEQVAAVEALRDAMSARGCSGEEIDDAIEALAAQGESMIGQQHVPEMDAIAGIDVHIGASHAAGSIFYFVEWYRDDDGASSYGDHAEFARWYGDRRECEERADGAAPLGGWTPVS